jgi:hypothetical protein
MWHWPYRDIILRHPQCPIAFSPLHIDLKVKKLLLYPLQYKYFLVAMVRVTPQHYFSQRCIWNQVPRQQTQISACINIHKACFLPRLKRMALNVISSEKIWMEFLYIFAYRREVTQLVAFLQLTKRSKQEQQKNERKGKIRKGVHRLSMWIFDVTIHYKIIHLWSWSPSNSKWPLTFC